MPFRPLAPAQNPPCDNAIPSAVAVAADELHAALTRLERRCLDESSEPLTLGASGVRESLQRLVTIGPLSPDDSHVKERVLKHLEEVLGCEHESYLALWRHLGNVPHPLDWEHRARAG